MSTIAVCFSMLKCFYYSYNDFSVAVFRCWYILYVGKSIFYHEKKIVCHLSRNVRKNKAIPIRFQYYTCQRKIFPLYGIIL